MKRAYLVVLVVVLTALVLRWSDWDIARVVRRSTDHEGSSSSSSSPDPTTTIGGSPARSDGDHGNSLRIVDVQGRPLSGVSIEVRDASNQDEADATYTTDADGLVPDLNEQRGYCFARKAGYAWAAFNLEWTSRVVLGPECVLTGLVVDDLGAPMSQRKLKVGIVSAGADYEFGFGAGPRFVTTDKDGRFRVGNLPQGFMSLFADWDGYQVIYEEWAPGEEDPKLIAIRRPIVRGRALDEHGRPIAAAILDAEFGTAYPRLEALGEAEPDGRFELPRLDAGEITVVAVQRGLASAPRTLRLEPRSVTEDVLLRLLPGRFTDSYVNVRVLDPDGRPLKGIRMRWMQKAWRPRGTRVNQLGLAVLPPAAETVLTRVSGGYAPPPPRTDESGIFRFALDLPPGSKLMVGNRLEWNSAAYLPTIREVVTASGPDVEPVDFRLRKGVLRRARIRGAGDGGELVLAGPAIRVGRKDGVSLFFVDPEATYQVLANVVIDRILLRASWKPPNTDIITEFEMPQRREDDSNPRIVRGLVRDGIGLALPGVRISSVGNLASGASDFGMTLADCTYAVGVRGAEAHLKFSKHGHGTQMLRYRFGQPWPETTVLPAASRLRVKISPPEGFRAADWRVELRAAAWTRSVDLELSTLGVRTFDLLPATYRAGRDDDTPFLSEFTLPPGSAGELGDLPPGRIEVRLWTDGYELRRAIDLVSGERRTVEFAPR